MVVTQASWSRKKRARGWWAGAGICAALSALVYAYAAADGIHEPTAADKLVAEFAAVGISDAATRVWKAVTMLGDTAAIVGAAIVLVLIIAAIRGLRHAGWLLVAIAAAYGINTGAKHLVARERPEAIWGIAADGFSFPSANAMMTIAVYGSFAVMVAGARHVHPVLRAIVVIAAVLLSFAMGWSRLYFNVHYATDIAAGLLAGGAIVCAAAALSKART